MTDDEMAPYAEREPAPSTNRGSHMLTPLNVIHIIVGTLVLLVCTTVAADTTIGRWCDRWGTAYKSHRIMTLTIRDDGQLVLFSKFGDGSSLREEIRERPHGIFEIVGSHYGDKMRIVPSDGNLQLLDRDGLIRIARRLENTARHGECSP